MRGIFHRKTDEERQAEAARKQVAEYRASPVGKAAAAFARGDAFFQIDIPLASMSWWAAFYDARVRDQSAPTDVLGQIEAAGWRLEHASWVAGPLEGKITGIFLFRRNDRSRGQEHFWLGATPAKAPAPPPTHPQRPAAAHRREMSARYRSVRFNDRPDQRDRHR